MVGLEHYLTVAAALFVIGMGNIVSLAMLNVSVQLSAPRWVTALAALTQTNRRTPGAVTHPSSISAQKKRAPQSARREMIRERLVR